MTRAPANLLAVRRLLLTHLDIDEDRSRSQDLEPAEVGIVGDTAHAQQGDSYHLGKPQQRSSGYSIGESTRDRALTEYACGLDVGDFRVTTPKGAYDLAHFSRWCAGQCAANAPDTRDIREIIYSPDGKTVKRWDRLRKRSSGDSSHLWHTHFSFFRDAIKAGRDQTPLFRRYLTTIGVLEDDVTEEQLIAAVQKALQKPLTLPGRVGDRMVAAGWDRAMEPWTALARVMESVVLGKPLDPAAIAAQVTTAVLAALPGDEPVSREDLEAALRSVLGSVDNPPAS